MNPISFLLLCWAVKVVVSQGYPGPRSTSMVNGQELWIGAPRPGAADITYRVRDYGALRPTLVYNCAHAPSLCKNVRQYLGAAATTTTLHFDDLSARKNLRRKGSSCGSGWINKRRTDGLNGPGLGRCPEADQPVTWTSSGFGVVSTVIYQDANGVFDKNRLATQVLKRNRDGTPSISYRPLGAILSCDEWPAATWIQGGTGATTYCTPMGSSCGGDSSTFATTEQNWQGSSHGNLKNWFHHLITKSDLNGKNFTILKFDFRLVDDASIGDATWIEANGHKRYCFGPAVTSDALCKKVWPDDPEPDNTP